MEGLLVCVFRGFKEPGKRKEAERDELWIIMMHFGGRKRGRVVGALQKGQGEEGVIPIRGENEGKPRRRRPWFGKLDLPLYNYIILLFAGNPYPSPTTRNSTDPGAPTPSNPFLIADIFSKRKKIKGALQWGGGGRFHLDGEKWTGACNIGEYCAVNIDGFLKGGGCCFYIFLYIF